MESIKLKNRTFITFETLMFGDYGGSGLVGNANLLHLENEYGDQIERIHLGTMDEYKDTGVDPSTTILEVIDTIGSTSVYLCEVEHDDEITCLSGCSVLNDDIYNALSEKWIDDEWKEIVWDSVEERLLEESILKSPLEIIEHPRKEVERALNYLELETEFWPEFSKTYIKIGGGSEAEGKALIEVLVQRCITKLAQDN